jgi:hypothetical protein
MQPATVPQPHLPGVQIHHQQQRVLIHGAFVNASMQVRGHGADVEELEADAVVGEVGAESAPVAQHVVLHEPRLQAGRWWRLDSSRHLGGRSTGKDGGNACQRDERQQDDWEERQRAPLRGWLLEHNQGQ